MKRTAELLIALFCAGFVYSQTTPAGRKPVSDDVFKSGAVRFVPEITITDEAMGGKGFFSQLSDLAVDDRGHIYVADYKEINIKVFDASGAFQKTIGRKGQGPGEFSALVQIEISNGRLYAWDIGHIIILDLEGAYIKSIPVKKAFTWRTLRALPDGRFLVEKYLVDRQDPGHKEEALLDLYSADFDFLKTIYRREIHRYKPITEPVAMDLSIPFATELFSEVLPDGRIVIGYSGSYEIEIHDPDKGKLSSFSRTYEPVEVTTKDKKMYFAGLSYMTQDSSGGLPTLHRGAADYMIKNTEFPKFKPPFSNIRTDAQGRIWVMLYGPEPSLDSFRMDVFDRSGRFLGHARIVDGLSYRRMAFVADGFWSIRTNDVDEPTVVKYRIEAAR
ncbi:MAG: 6-bladed beta-propeller [Acidobacteriota bacterium]|nr:6-bladed beta-propeller [Acidobacteriota bacterium]